MRWSPTIALAVATAGLLLFAGGARSVELVRDGGFEGGGEAWVQHDSWSRPTVCGPQVGCSAPLSAGAAPRRGAWWAQFGGTAVVAFPQVSSIKQTIAAASGTPLTLTFWLRIGQSNNQATLNVLLDGHVLFATAGDNSSFGSGYVQVVVPVHGSLVTGGPQTLSFEFDRALGLLVTHVFTVDDVSLQVPDIDLGVGLSSMPTTVTQGSTFNTTIAAGNAGPHGADDVWVEYPLPTGATLVGLSGDASCAAPETRPGHVMHCDFGTLVGGASKTVTATFSADEVGTITQHATVAARTGDANSGNNAASATVTVVAPSTLPPRTPPTKTPTCTAARRFTVPIRKGTKGTGLMIGKHAPTKAKILSARMTGPKTSKSQKLRHTKSKVTVDLRKVVAGRYTVRARVRVSSKKTLQVTRTYTACGSKTPAKSTKSKK